MGVRRAIRRPNSGRQVGIPKSARSIRNVPLLSRSLIADLREYLLAHPHNAGPEALFWPARSNGSRRLDWSGNNDCGGLLAAEHGGWGAISTQRGNGHVFVGRDVEDEQLRNEWLAYYEQHANPVYVKNEQPTRV